MELIPQRRSTPSGTDKPGALATPAAKPVRVLRTVKTFSRPRWLAVHLLVLALAVTMVLLGRWQLTVSNRKHFDLQNFGYALQWWAFTAFALFMWVRIMRDHLRPDPDPPPSTDGVLAVPASSESSAGPAWLATPAASAGAAPTVYRGYVMPSSAAATAPGDAYQGAYNDYLWQLALSDAANEDRASRESSTPDAANESDPDGVTRVYDGSAAIGPPDPADGDHQQ